VAEKMSITCKSG